MESNNSNSQILRKFFAMRCYVKHLVVSMRELHSNNQILTALKQDTQICMVLSSRQNMNMMNMTCGFAWLNDVKLNRNVRDVLTFMRYCNLREAQRSSYE